MPEVFHGTDLFDIIRTTRSMRRLKPDPVPNDLIRKILEAGVCAPSGGNMQHWRFLVIRDAKIKETVGAYYKRVWESDRPRRDSHDALFAVREGSRSALGLPPSVHSYALLPIGYPMGRFGSVRRVPLADVVYEGPVGQLFSDRSVEPEASRL
jgi:nitroreductase